MTKPVITKSEGMTGLDALDRFMSGDHGQGYGASATITIDPLKVTVINPGSGARYWDGIRWSCYPPDAKLEVKS